MRLYTMVLLMATLGLGSLGMAQNPKEIKTAKAGERLDVLNLKTPPEGVYAVTLLIEEQEVKAEFELKGNRIRCLKSEKAPGTRVLKGAAGRTSLIANGVFLVQVRGEGYHSSQFWAFKPNGAAEVKEMPDRGEKQMAVPKNPDK